MPVAIPLPQTDSHLLKEWQHTLLYYVELSFMLLTLYSLLVLMHIVEGHITSRSGGLTNETKWITIVAISSKASRISPDQVHDLP